MVDSGVGSSFADLAPQSATVTGHRGATGSFRRRLPWPASNAGFWRVFLMHASTPSEAAVEPSLEQRGVEERNKEDRIVQDELHLRCGSRPGSSGAEDDRTLAPVEERVAREGATDRKTRFFQQKDKDEARFLSAGVAQAKIDCRVDGKGRSEGGFDGKKLQRVHLRPNAGGRSTTAGGRREGQKDEEHHRYWLLPSTPEPDTNISFQDDFEGSMPVFDHFRSPFQSGLIQDSHLALSTGSHHSLLAIRARRNHH